MNERPWGEKAEGVAVSILVPNEGFKETDPVVLDILLKNFGPAPISLVVRSPWIDYAYVVHNAEGRELNMNDDGRQRAEASLEGRTILRDLKPGESRADDFVLNKAFDLKPDTYSVTLTLSFARPGRLGESLTVRSNTVTFQVTS